LKKIFILINFCKYFNCAILDTLKYLLIVQGIIFKAFCLKLQRAQEKENLISDRAVSNAEQLLGYDLASFYSLAKQQESLEAELDTLKDELERLTQESVRLSSQYPETRDHIETRLEDARIQYESLLRELKTRKERIQAARELFAFSNEFQELSEWFRDMLARITAQQDLNSIGAGGGTGNEVNLAELLVKRHREMKIEIDLQQARVLKFGQRADELAARKKMPPAIQNEIKGTLFVSDNFFINHEIALIFY